MGTFILQKQRKDTSLHKATKDHGLIISGGPLMNAVFVGARDSACRALRVRPRNTRLISYLCVMVLTNAT